MNIIEKPGEVKNLIHNEADMIKYFPNAKELYSKISFAFWEVEPGVFCKISYNKKDGENFDKYFENHTSFKFDDVDFSTFDIKYFYTLKK